MHDALAEASEHAGGGATGHPGRGVDIWNVERQHMPMLLKRTKDQTSAGYLDGQLLVAMPGMVDDRFARAVIYVCAQSA